MNINDENNIIFERKLKEGSGSKLYGIEICKSMITDSEFIDKAFEIRNRISKAKKSVLSKKKSVYNNKKIINACEICNSTESLEIDHIEGQVTADAKGFLKKGIHKNNLSNLCTLCHNCHLQKTQGKIIINGYKESINGKFLDWKKLE